LEFLKQLAPNDARQALRIDEVFLKHNACPLMLHRNGNETLCALLCVCVIVCMCTTQRFFLFF
jgi:hypothetical protein